MTEDINNQSEQKPDALQEAMAKEVLTSTVYDQPDELDVPVRKLNALGWANIDKALLGYKGKYYSDKLVIEVKPFSSEEVLHFTAVNEKNPFEVDAATRYVLENCVRCRLNNVEVETSKTIFNHDRLALMFLCRTYSDMRTNLTFEKTCTLGKCKHKQVETINVRNMVYKDDSPIAKFWNGKFFNIETKQGIVKYKPLTIAESNDVLQFTMDNKDDPEVSAAKLKVLTALYPYLIVDNKTADEAYDAMLSAGKDKIALWDAVSKAYAISTSLLVTSTCQKCNGTEDVPMTFPRGITSIVVDKIEIDDILL